MTSPDLFTWLRGLKAGNWPGRDAACAHPAQVRLWPLALDVIETAEQLSENAGAGIPWPKIEQLRDTFDAFAKAAEKELS